MRLPRRVRLWLRHWVRRGALGLRLPLQAPAARTADPDLILWADEPGAEQAARMLATRGRRVFVIAEGQEPGLRPGLQARPLEPTRRAFRIKLRGGGPRAWTAGVGALLRWADIRALTLVGVPASRRVEASLLPNHRELDLAVTDLPEVDLRAAESALPEPTVSVIVLTYNNLALTRVCLDSLDRHSNYAGLEIIVVDNASSDGSRAYLAAWAAAGPGRTLIQNEDNRGFSAGNNQGMARASGAYLILLNNDTCVTDGWLRTLVGHLRRDQTLGLVGPVTRNIANEARVDVRYRDLSEMHLRAAEYTRAHVGQLTPMRTATFFCVAMPRHVYERVGPLDEGYGRGFFEDDDYCRRVEQLGLRIACADDVFVHHHSSASFNRLGQAARQELFEQSWRRYESKWGPWPGHRRRA